jgi:acyl-CoA hydrolase
MPQQLAEGAGAGKKPSESATEMVQVVLPNDANPLGFILGGTVMHLIDIAGAIACHRHTRTLLVTAAVDGLQFLHPIKVGDLIMLKARVTAAWSTSLEVEVEVFSEEILTGLRRLTSVAYLTFVSIDAGGQRLRVPPLILETEEEQDKARAADLRRADRLSARKELESRGAPRMATDDGHG